MKSMEIKKMVLAVPAILSTVLYSGIASADCPPSISGAVYSVQADASPTGTLTIASDCRSGQFYFPDFGTYNVFRMKVSAPNQGGSREIAFLRNDAYRQYYNGWISSNGGLISGYLINVNNNILSIEKFPFFAKKP